MGFNIKRDTAYFQHLKSILFLQFPMIDKHTWENTLGKHFAEARGKQASLSAVLLHTPCPHLAEGWQRGLTFTISNKQ